MNQDIAPYFDGTRQRFADPFAVERILNAYLDGNPKGYRDKSVSSIAEESCPAMARIKAAVCAAFGLPPYDDSTGFGTKEDVVLAVFDQFLSWRQKKNLNTGTSPILPASMALDPSLSAVDWKATMTSLMDCGCQ